MGKATRAFNISCRIRLSNCSIVSTDKTGGTICISGRKRAFNQAFVVANKSSRIAERSRSFSVSGGIAFRNSCFVQADQAADIMISSNIDRCMHPFQFFAVSLSNQATYVEGSFCIDNARRRRIFDHSAIDCDKACNALHIIIYRDFPTIFVINGETF